MCIMCVNPATLDDLVFLQWFKAAKIVKGIGSREGLELIAYSAEQRKLDASYAWTVREAFVCFFGGNPYFDASEFRADCGPLANEHAGAL